MRSTVKQKLSETLKVKELARQASNRWRPIRELLEAPDGIRKLQEWAQDPMTQAVIAGCRQARTPRANLSMTTEQAAHSAYIDSGWHGVLDFIEGLASKTHVPPRQALIRHLVEVEKFSEQDAAEIAANVEMGA